MSYIPPCEEDALVCVITPANRFEDTNIDEVSFQVREIHRDQSSSADGCATPYPMDEPASKYPEFSVSAAHPVEMIRGREISAWSQRRSCYWPLER